MGKTYFFLEPVPSADAPDVLVVAFLCYSHRAESSLETRALLSISSMRLCVRLLSERLLLVFLPRWSVFVPYVLPAVRRVLGTPGKRTKHIFKAEDLFGFATFCPVTFIRPQIFVWKIHTTFPRLISTLFGAVSLLTRLDYHTLRI
jgi:hypothetical protein